MRNQNGATVVFGSNSAVVDDFELIDRMAYELKPRRSKLDEVRATLRRATLNLNALERISASYSFPPIRDGANILDPVAAIKQIGARVEEASLEIIRDLVAERCA